MSKTETEKRRQEASLDDAGHGDAGSGGTGEGGEPDHSRFWYDFGRYNLTGWSIVLPTLGGIALGYWLDQSYPVSFSWTITLMVVGLALGCMNAWYWISRTNRNGGRDKHRGRGQGRGGGKTGQ